MNVVKYLNEKLDKYAEELMEMEATINTDNRTTETNVMQLYRITVLEAKIECLNDVLEEIVNEGMEGVAD